MQRNARTGSWLRGCGALSHGDGRRAFVETVSRPDLSDILDNLPSLGVSAGLRCLPWLVRHSRYGAQIYMDGRIPCDFCRAPCAADQEKVPESKAEEVAAAVDAAFGLGGDVVVTSDPVPSDEKPAESLSIGDVTVSVAKPKKRERRVPQPVAVPVRPP